MRHPSFPPEAEHDHKSFRQRVHSITWSARSSTDGGIVSPSALAALRLRTNWGRLSCSTGRVPGSAPSRTRWTCLAENRPKGVVALAIAGEGPLADGNAVAEDRR